MSYSDELRELQRKSKSGKAQNYREKVNEMVKNYTPRILALLRNYASNGKSGVKGYLKLTYDNEYGASYNAQIVQIDPQAFKTKPTAHGISPYSYVADCALSFSQNETELADGTQLLKQGFLNSMSGCGFRRLVIEAVTAARYDVVKGLLGEKCVRNASLNYHLLYLDIEW